MMTVLAVLLYLIVAACCAGLAAYLVPGSIPGGFLTAAVVGIIGAWIGANLMGGFGPTLAGVPLVPAILGSAIVVFAMALISRSVPS